VHPEQVVYRRRCRVNANHREPWNKGKTVGQKAPFKVKDIRALRLHLHGCNRRCRAEVDQARGLEVRGLLVPEQDARLDGAPTNDGSPARNQHPDLARRGHQLTS
jgi:hypothetical protein